MTTKNLTKLQQAVINQLGDNDVLQDIANHGASGGYSGFTYTRDCCEFFEANQKAIVELVNDMAWNVGTYPIPLVANFGCLAEHDDRETRDEIGRCIYGKPLEDDRMVPEALAWLALEETARELCE